MPLTPVGPGVQLCFLSCQQMQHPDLNPAMEWEKAQEQCQNRNGSEITSDPRPAAQRSQGSAQASLGMKTELVANWQRWDYGSTEGSV